MFLQTASLVEAQAKQRLSYLSSLTQDCIEQGISYYDGGALYGNMR